MRSAHIRRTVAIALGAVIALFTMAGSRSPAAVGSVFPAAARGLGQAVATSGCSHSGTCTVNWAGWFVGSGSGNGFQGVKANWNAPCTGGVINSMTAYSSWVGLGGWFGQFNTEPLEQAGIILQPDGTYRLFWDYVANNGAVTNEYIDPYDVVTCADHLSAWVYYGNKSPNYCPLASEFVMHVQDNSTGASWDSGCMFGSAGVGIQSAEWIDERPSITNPNCTFGTSPFYYQLADFQWTNWSSVLAQANYSGAAWKNPNNFTNSRFVMHDDSSGLDISYPDQTSIGSNDLFTGRWKNYGTYCDY